MKSGNVLWTVILAIVLIISVLPACSGDSDETPSPGATEPPPAGTETPTAEPITTDSGLKFIELREGTGLQPQFGDRISFYYVGTLEDGTVFDQVTEGDPFSLLFGLEGLMPGVEEGIGMMKAGGKAELIIPPELGYGGTKVGEVPANSTISIELDLLDVDRPDPPRQIAEEDYVTTESGLKYYDFVVGNGAVPQTNDTLVMHNSVWRADGTPLGSTQDQGMPQIVQYYPGRLLPGWEEGLSTMQAGGKRQLVIPPELAYGDEGYRDIIPPGMGMIMEIDLLAVVPLPEFSSLTEIDDTDYETTGSGLKYYDLEEGEGPAPEAGQTVVVHYSGWLTDGTLFDSSINRGTPYLFTLGQRQTVPGFEEGVSTMKVGGKRQIVIPPELGYGEQGSGKIPANSTLIFEVELSYVF